MYKTYRETYKEHYGEYPVGICPYQVGYEQYTVPIKTNGCIHKAITCNRCWRRTSIPYKIGDVVHAHDNYIDQNGIILENTGNDSVLVVFGKELPHLHHGNHEFINAPTDKPILRFFYLSTITPRPELQIEDVMPREEFISLLEMGYKEGN